MFQLLNIVFYPFALGLCLPIILGALALEKEEKIQDLLKINGMSMRKFYISNLMFWFLFCSIVCLVFFLSGYLILDDGFFSKNNPLDFLVFSIGWNLQQIVFAFFLLTMISTSGAASAVGYILSTLGILFSVNMTSFIYPFPDHLPVLWNLIPQCNYVRIMYYFMVKGSSEIQADETHEFKICMFFLYFNLVFYGILIYVISKKKFWKKVYEKVFKKKKEKLEHVNLTLTDSVNVSFVSQTTLNELGSMQNSIESNVHESSTRERNSVTKIISSLDKPKYRKKMDNIAIICQNVCKQYPNGKKALNYLNLKVPKGEVYGLLGPNGAGKTTLISILTSFLEKTSGKVFINSLDMDEHKLPKKLAFCPQFNIQWPNLTVREHLIIFGFLRNIEWKNIKNLVEEIVSSVGLIEKIDVEASKLSGGMRRRLSIAIALMGETEIIFLDEPTTGLDPKRRRELWDIIKSIRDGKTFVISTHLMEEAEFLCDKIGVMTHGQLRATGTSNELKQAFVNYFQVELTLKEDDDQWTPEMKSQTVEALGGTVLYEFGRLLKVQVPNSGRQSYQQIFKTISQCKHFVKSWSLKNGSLEDAFAVIEEKYF
jgi:ABC-type multidrug transport system ATPase subunit